MGCGGNCGGGGSSKTSNHSAKKTPNWGMTMKPVSKSNSTAKGSSGFGTPKVKMSFRGNR